MPTYEYACSGCGRHHEVMQSFADAPLTVCPECGGELRKVFSPVGIVLKGSGFYKTDSRGSSPKRAEKATAESGSGSSSGSEASGDTSGKSDSSDKATKKDPAPASGNGSSTPAAASSPSTSSSPA